MKIRSAVLFTCLLAAPALAQQLPEKTYNLTVTAAEINVLAEALGEVPAKRANPLIMKLNAQVQAQDKPAEPAKEPAKTPAK